MCLEHRLRRSSNYILNLHWTPGFNRLGKDMCETMREIFMFWDLVWIILDIWRHISICDCDWVCMVGAFFGSNIISSQHNSRGATMIKLHVECRKPQVRNTTDIVDWQLWERRHLKGILPHEAMDDISYVLPYNIDNSYCTIFNVYVMYMFSIYG